MQKKYWNDVAKKYFENIMSPFQEGVKNPFFEYIAKFEGKNKSVIDIGTGIGNAIPHLADRFAHVIAIDISEKMIEVAKNNHKFNNVSFFVRDARNLEEFHDKFDIAVAVNSIIIPSLKDLEKVIEEVYKVLKMGGKLIAIFPSMEAILYQAMLVEDAVFKETGDEKKAKSMTVKEVGKNRFSFMFGIDKEGFRQKYFYRFEVGYRLRKPGFKHIRIRKVFYPWNISEDSGFSAFPGKPHMWDLFVVAEK